MSGREEVASAAWAFGLCACATVATALLLAVLVVDRVRTRRGR